MDDAGCLRRGIALVDGPGPHFLDAGREVGGKAKQLVAGVDQAVEAGFVKAEVGEEHLLFLIIEVGDLGFDGGADGDHLGLLGGCMGAHRVDQRVVLEAILGDVGDVEHGLSGDQAEGLEAGPFFLRQVEGAHRPGLVELGEALLEDGDEYFGVLVAGAGRAAVAVERLVDGGHVGERQFGVDDLDVTNRIDAAGNVHDVVVGEAADDMHDSVGFADVGEELVAETFALRGAGDQASNVHEFDDGRLYLLWLDDDRQLGETRVGHLDDANVRLNGAERVVGGVDARFGQGVKECGLANVGQTDDAAFQ